MKDNEFEKIIGDKDETLFISYITDFCRSYKQEFQYDFSDVEDVPTGVVSMYKETLYESEEIKFRLRFGSEESRNLFILGCNY